MKSLTAITFLVVLALAYAQDDDLTVECRENTRPSGVNDCEYCCKDGGSSSCKFGAYPDGLPCDYTGVLDGVCKDGLCHYKPQ